MDDFLRSQRDLQRMIEESTGMHGLRELQERVRSIVEPFRTPYMGARGEAMAEMQRQQKSREEMVRSILPTFATTSLESAMSAVVPSMTEAMRLRHAQFEIYGSDFLKAREASTGMLETIRRDVLGDAGLPTWTAAALLGDLRVISAAAEAMRPSSVVVLATAVEGWRAIFDEEHERGLAMTNSLIETARSLRLSSAFLARTDDAIQAHAVEQAIALTDMQLRATEDFVLRLEPIDEAVDDPQQRRLLVPRRQRFELQREAASIEHMDLEGLLALVPVGQVVLVARELLSVVIEINESRVTAGDAAMFKVTQRVVRVSAELPFALVVDRRTFADFIDDLYWLLYEGAGSGTLRFLASTGGSLPDDDCEIVFVIKRLRNHLRHDPEHGSARDIERKFQAVTADLAARGFNGLPRTREAYGRLQRIVLEEAVAFVRRLQDAL